MDDGIDRPGLFHLTVIKHHDVISDLRHHRQIMGDIDSRRAFFLDDLLEGFQHFDLGGHVKGGGGFIQHQQIRFTAERHRRHQALQLAA